MFMDNETNIKNKINARTKNVNNIKYLHKNIKHPIPSM